MFSRSRSSGAASPSWRSHSPSSSSNNRQTPRRRVPYSLRSLPQRLHQIGPIEDTLFSDDYHDPFDNPEDLSIERQQLPSSSTSSTTSGIFSSSSRDQNRTVGSGEGSSIGNLASSQYQQGQSNPGMVDFPEQPSIKPQHLKESPFAGFPVQGSRGGATSANTEQKSVAVIAPTPLTQSEARTLYDKWMASFGCRGRSSTASPQGASVTTISRPSSSTSSTLRFSAGHRAAAVGVGGVVDSSAQPINLSRPSSTAGPAAAAVELDSPLDLRSPGPTSRIMTPAAPASPRNNITSFCGSPFGGQVQANQSFQKFGSIYREKMQLREERPKSLLGAPTPPPLPPVTPKPTSSSAPFLGRFSYSDASGFAANNSTPTTEILKETTKKLHSMNLRSHRSVQPTAPQHLSAVGERSVVVEAMDTGMDNQPTVVRPFQPMMNVDPTGNNANDSQITFHYPPQELPFANRSYPPLQQPQTFLPAPPTITTFRGLSNKVNDGSFSVTLTDKLEENYMKCRNLVMSREGALITPLRFLGMLCNRMQLNIHAESFRFQTSGQEVQFRTELYVGGFCGVGHGLSIGFSKQLAAAHVLERMRIHFRGIKQTSYALFPGNRYTKIGEKLEKLCRTYDLGEMRMEFKDRLQQHQNNAVGGRNFKRGWNWNSQDFDMVRWECSCFVQRFQAVVLSDNMQFGGYAAAKDMYLSFVKPPEVPVIQIKDYFAVGVDCSMLKDIHCSLLLHRPSINKLKWMEEYQVPASQLDAILHDPMNDSRYLMGHQTVSKREASGGGMKIASALEGKLAEFRRNVKEALEWIQTISRRNNLQGMRLRQGGRSGGNAIAPLTVDGTMKAGEGGLNKEELDENDAEVEDIFHDAIMDVELM